MKLACHLARLYSCLQILLCYNKIMKNLFKLIIVFLFLFSSVNAATFDVLTLPADMFNSKQNYYGFEEASEIFANDIIKNFNSSNGKVQSPNLNEVKAQFDKNSQLKQTAQTALDKYKNTNKIDYEAFKKLGNSFSCKSVLLISSSVVTNKNSIKRGIWEVLKVSTEFNTIYPYRLETSIVLLDVVNDIIMWSNSYSIKLGNNSNVFSADNFAKANEEYEKLKLYSQNIVAASAFQNMMLRFFPKSIRPLEREFNNNSGGALRFERTLPDKPKEQLKPREDFYGDMIYGI